MANPTLDEVVDDLDEAVEVIPYTYSITAYGADYPVDSIVKRMKAGDIAVPTFAWNPSPGSDVVSFQREYVWPRTKADRFIESLLLGLPVPGIFLVKEPSGVQLVLDGHQRLFTLRAFYDGILDKKEYRLANVQARFEGKRYADLDPEDRRRIDDSIIHATVVRQDQPSEDQSSIYVIFERLNTGGVNLQPQEIRVALYHGELGDLLAELNDQSDWRTLFGTKSRRLKDMELILRFFAMYYHGGKYRSPMKDFLNRYMASNRKLERQDRETLKGLFESATSFIGENLGPNAFRPYRNINAAVVDSVMVGIASRLAGGKRPKNKSSVDTAYKKLIASETYKAAVETGTAQEASVQKRLEMAKKGFASIK
jgi:hypothetical protein